MEEVSCKPYNSTEEYFSNGISHPYDGERETSWIFSLDIRPWAVDVRYNINVSLHLVLIVLIGVWVFVG